MLWQHILWLTFTLYQQLLADYWALYHSLCIISKMLACDWLKWVMWSVWILLIVHGIIVHGSIVHGTHPLCRKLRTFQLNHHNILKTKYISKIAVSRLILNVFERIGYQNTSTDSKENKGVIKFACRCLVCELWTKLIFETKLGQTNM